MCKIKIIDEKNISNRSVINNENNEYSYIVINIKNNVKYIQYKLLNIDFDDYLSEEDKKYNSLYPLHLNGFFYYSCRDEISHILNYCDKYLLFKFKNDLVNLVVNIDSKIEILKEFNILKEKEV